MLNVLSAIVCAFPPVLARGRSGTVAPSAGASRPSGFFRDLPFARFSWRFQTPQGRSSLSKLQLYSGLSLKLLPCAILRVCSSTVCVHLVRPRDSLLPRIIKQRKLTPFSVHFQPGGVKVFPSSGSLVDNFASFLHGSLKHPAPTRTKLQLSAGTANSRTPVPPSLTLLRALHHLGSLPQFNCLHRRLSSDSASWRNPIT